MSTLTKLALGAMGRLRPKPTLGEADSVIPLPSPDKMGGLPLMQAMARRQSAREFAPRDLPLAMLSNLLWAANGVNREDGKRTAPSAMGVHEIDVYVTLPGGAYLYAAETHELRLVAGNDVRRVTGFQDFVDQAPVDLVYVADYSRMTFVPADMRRSYACAVAGAIMQNAYLFAASHGLAAVIRSWIDRVALADALGLGDDQEALLAQTLGFPKG